MLNRTEAPPFSRSTTYTLLPPTSVILPNGLPIHWIRGGSQPVVKVELIINGGRWMEALPGASYFAAQLLSKGTHSKDSFTIAQHFDQYGAHLEISPGLDLLSISLYTLSRTLQPSLDLLVELLSASVFPEHELTLLKSIYLQNLKINNEKTSFLASKAFRSALYGSTHPYGVEFDEQHIEAVSRETLLAHHKHCIHDVQVIASGGLTDVNIGQLSDTLSQLRVQAVESPSHPLPDRQPVLIRRNKEGSVQASLRMGKRFIGRLHPDYAGVLFLTHILGGYFGSRLMKNIREEKGLTYGIYSSIHALQHDSYLVIGADVNNENVELTFAEIEKEFRKLATLPVDNDELETARNHFIGSLQAELTTAFVHADKFKSRLVYGLPDDYYQRLIHAIDALTADQLMATASQYFDPEHFSKVAVG